MEKNEITSSCGIFLIGGSAGSLEVLLKVFPKLKTDLDFAIVVIMHRKSSSDSMLSDLLSGRTLIPLKEVEDKQPLKPAHIYIAPADYHLLFEKNGRMSLDYSEKINYSRPSIDVSFESAAEAFGPSAVALLISGANADGAMGLKAIKQKGGRVLVQDPGTADSPFMPTQGIKAVEPDGILKVEDIAGFINTLQ